MGVWIELLVLYGVTAAGGGLACRQMTAWRARRRGAPKGTVDGALGPAGSWMARTACASAAGTAGAIGVLLASNQIFQQVPQEAEIFVVAGMVAAAAAVYTTAGGLLMKWTTARRARRDKSGRGFIEKYGEGAGRWILRYTAAQGTMFLLTAPVIRMISNVAGGTPDPGGF